jgi:hypothetical protein
MSMFKAFHSLYFITCIVFFSFIFSIDPTVFISYDLATFNLYTYGNLWFTIQGQEFILDRKLRYFLLNPRGCILELLITS